jgi:hypothetical protein
MLAVSGFCFMWYWFVQTYTYFLHCKWDCRQKASVWLSPCSYSALRVLFWCGRKIAFLYKVGRAVEYGEKFAFLLANNKQTGGRQRPNRERFLYLCKYRTGKYIFFIVYLSFSLLRIDIRWECVGANRVCCVFATFYHLQNRDAWSRNISHSYFSGCKFYLLLTPGVIFTPNKMNQAILIL